MFSWVNVDSCKTPGCKNVGVLNSSDYQHQGEKYTLPGLRFSLPHYFGTVTQPLSSVGQSGMERVD